MLSILPIHENETDRHKGISKTKNKKQVTVLHTYGTLLALYLSNFTRQIQDVLRPGLDLLLCLILDHDKGLRRNMTNNDTLS